MDERMKRLLGDGPYPFPIGDISNESVIDTFVGQGMIVISPKGSFNMPIGKHTHKSYEFLLPISDMPYTLVENKSTYFENNRLFPINSEQSHGPSKVIKGCKLLAFQIDTDTFNDISHPFCNKKDITFENNNFKIGNEIFSLLKMFTEETSNLQTASEFIQQNIINLIVINLLRQINSNIPKLITEKNYCEKENINRAICYLHEEFNNDFSLEEVARVANLSQYHFIRIFKTITGKTPYDYLLDIKIQKSKELLKIKRYTITDICFMCGFNNPGHFSTVFKRKVGVLPSQYRQL